jgi:hypothetical protein
VRVYEHVLADNPRWARRQRRIDPIWTRLGGGCHVSRDTGAAIARAGFQITEQGAFPVPAVLVREAAAPPTSSAAHAARRREACAGSWRGSGPQGVHRF